MNPTLILIQSLTVDFQEIEQTYEYSVNPNVDLNTHLRDRFFVKLDLLKEVCFLCENTCYQPVIEGIEAIDIDEFVSFLPILINICNHLEKQLQPAPVKVLALPQSTEVN